MESAEVVVIGGGVIGCATAWQLMRRGIDVLLLEREQIATGSSSRGSGGMRHFFAHSADAELSRESIAFYSESEEVLGERVPFERNGYLYLAREHSELDELTQIAATPRSLGCRVDLLGAAELAERVPGLVVDDLAGGVLSADDAIGVPFDATHAFARALERSSARVRLRAEVASAERSDDQITALVLTDGERIACGAIVVCTGAWTGELGRRIGMDLAVRPHRRQLVYSEPHPRPPQLLPFVIEHWSSLCFRRRGEGLMTTCGLGENVWDSFDTTPDSALAESVIRRVRDRYAPAREVEFTTVRAGLYEMTPDAKPLLGRRAGTDNAVICAGFSGHGFMHAPAASRIAATLTLDEFPESETVAFDPNRFDGREVAQVNVL